ncbi:MULTISPECIES: hypothetical protein [Pseudanabaena]|uniref:Uncharacterized protein n=2 Tax=Pseudanabaena TaxID=1152 RepID=L8N0R5_9CYAN|nr:MULTISPECIES: hypothetical protein [Pseudanabaena]ELS32674.1 hypothetical protein Pse7429DRAFT_2158 [Pseudanabaena biceps PCC 7429]MDG3495099.1 hypothetical protein [Pseudanabaena catenata USMAC16]
MENLKTTLSKEFGSEQYYDRLIKEQSVKQAAFLLIAYSLEQAIA